MSTKKQLDRLVMRITQLGEPVLRKKTAPVSKTELPKMKALAKRMLVTMIRANGVGIAANQVGVSKRIFIVAPQPSERYPHAAPAAPLVMINPKLLSGSSKKVLDWEGCLSIPGLRALVPRHHAIVIQFTDLAGKTYKAKMSGFVARIFQHEFDHINGGVYMDRVADTKTYCMEAVLFKKR